MLPKIPLDNIRIVEMGAMITAPLAAMMLADLGADVIKVERPEGGDPFRSFRGSDYSPNFTAYNRNKRSLALNLGSDDGKAILLKLIATADVLLENFRPGVMDRLGLSANVLITANPRLIHATITGFGADGPYRTRPSFDTVSAALSGMTSVFADDDFHDLRGPTITDNVTGMYAAYGILGALMRRARSGSGERVEVNMLEASIAFMPDLFANFTELGMTQTPYTRAASSQSYIVRCRDGKLLALHLSSPQKFWQGLVAALESTDLAADTRFTARMDRVANYHALKSTLDTEFARRDRADWIARLEQNDVPYAPVHSIAEVLDDPQVRHLGTFHPIAHPVQGTLTAIHNPVTLDRERLPARYPPPLLGAHTGAILADLGYDSARCAELRAGGVIGGR